MSPHRARLMAPALVVPILIGTVAGLGAQSCVGPCVGPGRGAIIAAGGGALPDQVYEEFVRLAGGGDAKIVLIPTAGDQYGALDAWTATERLRAAGVDRIEVVHTRSRSVADLEAFAAPLKEATGVWFSGGKQWRIVDVYLHTRTHVELQNVLLRGGVVGGNSAGASVLASFLVRGAESNDLLTSPDRLEGFDFLHNVAIDQHLAERGREADLLGLLKERPHLLGIGLNEGAALVVTRDAARVLGNRVAIYDVTDPSVLIPLRWLKPGDVYDLGARRLLLEEWDDAPPLVVP